jgi:predicted enzyme related to lactoylglutathione lyase
MTPTSISQIILFVKDMETEVRFYRDMLGLEVRFPYNIDDFSEEMWVELEAGACTLALHGGAEEMPGQQHQIVFRVDDIEKTWKKLHDAGIQIDDIRPLEDGLPAAKAVDPEGHRFTIR